MKKTRTFLRLFIWVLVCIATLSSCKSTYTEWYTVDDFPAFRKQCIGTTHNQIVTKLGAPQRQVSDGNGGTILIYENTTTTTVSNSIATAYNVNVFSRTYTPGLTTASQQITNTDYVQYFVNSNNVCYDVKTNIPMTHKKQGNSYRSVNPVKTFFFVCGVTLATICGMMLITGAK